MTLMLGVSFLVSDLMLASLDIAERAISIVLSGDEEHVLASTTHLPPFKRRMLLRGALRKLIPNTAAELIELADMLSYIPTALWSVTRQIFTRHYKNRTRRIRYVET